MLFWQSTVTVTQSIYPLKVACIQRANERSESSGGDLRVKVLVDHMRGTRGAKNSRTMLLGLVRQFGERVSVALYHTPDLRGLRKIVLPERYNETVGLSHLKVYLFDDTLIMSGYVINTCLFVLSSWKVDFFRSQLWCTARCIVISKVIWDYIHMILEAFVIRLRWLSHAVTSPHICQLTIQENTTCGTSLCPVSNF